VQGKEGVAWGAVIAWTSTPRLVMISGRSLGFEITTSIGCGDPGSSGTATLPVSEKSGACALGTCEVWAFTTSSLSTTLRRT
jgi:hypothetical protein